MKKVAFFVQHMLCGGIEKSLINLCKNIRDNCKIIVYVMDYKGEFIDKLPDGVEVKEIPIPESERKYLPVGGAKIAARERIASKKYIQALVILFRHALKIRGFAELSVNFSKIPPLKETYDIAVNYNLHSPFLVRYFSEKVTAEKKYSWIHNDFTTTGYRIELLKKYLDCMTGFFAVSKDLLNQFVAIFPEFTDKCELALNLIDKSEVLKSAEEFYPEEYISCPINTLKLLSVGRLEEQKGFDMAISVCRRLKQEGLNFRWFIVGGGSLIDKLKNLAISEGVQDCIYFIGTRINPYPYFKNCDIYVQPSRHEGYVTTISEAKVFNRPIVVTDVSGANEQLIDGVNGDIAEINVVSIFTKLRSLMKSYHKREMYSKALELSNADIQTEYLRIFR